MFNNYQRFETVKNKIISYLNVRLKQAAFTVAEVLIVLGIIGIIAEVTLPTLIKNTHEAEYRAGFKKTYSDVAQVINQYNHDIGKSFISGTMYPYTIDPAFWGYFKTEKICTDAVAQGCWHSAFYTLDGTTSQVKLGKNALPSCGGAILNNGTIINITVVNTLPCNISFGGDRISLPYIEGYSGTGVVFIFDVNGFKGPNRVGKDIYLAHSIDTYFLRAPLVYLGANETPYDSCTGSGASCSYAALTGN